MADNTTTAAPEGVPTSIETRRTRCGMWVVVFWLTALSLAALQEWSSRHYISQDAVSYIEVAEAYARGDWQNALNAYWSPMYCWILAVSRLICPPSLYWEATALHMTSIPIHLFALASFHFFWTGLTTFRQVRRAASQDQDYTTFSPRMWIVLGYTLFLWVAFAFCPATGADTLVINFVLLSAGMLLRIRCGRDGWGNHVILGVVLGLGYLAKAILMPVGLICLVLAFFCTRPIRRAVPRVVAAGLMMAVVAAPFVAALSHKMGRFTTGDTGRLNYAWLAGKPTTQTQPATEAEAKHFPRRIHELPTIEEFATPVAGTYPMWYDPAHWNEHLRVKLDRWRQWTVLRKNLGICYDLLVVPQGAILACLLVLLLMAKHRGQCLRDVAAAFFLLMPAFAIIGLYALLSVETRFMGGPMILISAALLYAVRLPSGPLPERLLRCVGFVLVLSMVVPIIDAQIKPAERLMKDVRARRDTAPHQQWYVAKGLEKLGLKPGDRVAILGSINPYFARLAGAKVVAKIPDDQAELFLTADDKTRAETLKALAAIQVRALVARSGAVADQASGTGLWQQCGHTDHHAILIPR